MNLKNFALLSLLLVMLGACQNDNLKSEDDLLNNLGPDPELVAEHDIEVYQGTQEGPRPVVGDELTYFEKVFKNDERLGNPLNWNQVKVATLPPDSVLQRPINPSYAAMFKLRIGDSCVITQPINGLDTLSEALKPDDVFRYEIKLLRIRKPEDIEVQAQGLIAREKQVLDQARKFISDYTSGSLSQPLKSTEEGIQYIIHEKGKGNLPKKGTPVFVNYMSLLMDGTAFDNTFQYGESIAFTLGEGKMIRGFEEILQQLPKGTTCTFVVPSVLAYGTTGKGDLVPPNSDLVFYVELLNF